MNERFDICLANFIFASRTSDEIKTPGHCLLSLPLARAINLLISSLFGEKRFRNEYMLFKEKMLTST